MKDSRLLVNSDLLICFLTGNPPEQASKVKELFSDSSASKRTLVIIPTAVAFAVQRLESDYRLEVRPVAESMLALLSAGRNLEVRQEDLFIPALEIHRDQGIPIDLAFLAAAAQAENTALASCDSLARNIEGVRNIDLG
jgi:predicted nucleic acid-binding protein